jgi:uncharacterized protein YlzI (FlbEa/FlbD family)
MITLTTIQGEEFVLNAEHIFQIIDAGDTIVVCNNGKRIRVRENFDSIIDKSINFHKRRSMPSTNGNSKNL